MPLKGDWLNKILTKVTINSQYLLTLCGYAKKRYHIIFSPTLGGALEADPSQLQLTISVCLAIRTSHDPFRGHTVNLITNLETDIHAYRCIGG